MSDRRIAMRGAWLVVVSLSISAACTGPRIDSVRNDDLDGARRALALNLVAIQRHDVEAYLAQYEESPDLAVLDADSLHLGYVIFAEARRASDDWPDTLISGKPTLLWIAPGVVWAAFPYTSVTAGDTSSGWSERLFLKTVGGWKIAMTGAMTRPR